MSSIIEDIQIRKILDSRGNPTVEVEIFTEAGVGVAAAPSGASTGVHEVLAFPKKGINKAIEYYENRVIQELLGVDAQAQREIDSILHEIDGTKNFSKIGGNLTVATSLALAKAAAFSLGMPLYQYLGGPLVKGTPRPLGNVLGGGRHAVGGTDIQEFLVFADGPNAAESVFANARVHKLVRDKLKKILPEVAIGKGDEGAWVASVSNEEALALVAEACKEVAAKVKFKVSPSLDIAASEFYKNNRYNYKDRVLTPKEQIEFVVKLIEKYNLHIVEDPLEQDDFDGYAELTERVGDRCLIMGDDLFVTSKSRLAKGIQMGACNAILIKPNQVGTLTDTYETIKLAHNNGYKTIISHRSGETPDDTIAHLGVAFGCYGIKTGAVSGERIAKLNELIRIEEDFT